MSDRRPYVDSEIATKVARVYEKLVATYGIPPWEPTGDPLGELVATILSQHTSDINSERAYRQLRAVFPAWEQVRDAPTDDVVGAIRSGGLAQQKAERIQQILRILTERLGDAPLTLDSLDAMPLDDALAWLRELPGVGPKTAACVLLFALGKPAFPVDTHVWRVTKRLGLIGSRVSAESAHETLQAMIPQGWRYTMHIDLIRHGRQICYARNPACFRCPISSECQYFWDVVAAGEAG
ncbi:MAG TPA: endonuclease III [Ktedonobacterales bacterium]|nr:endonuclease III [Ktedonobacterales bacterium]